MAATTLRRIPRKIPFPQRNHHHHLSTLFEPSSRPPSTTSSTPLASLKSAIRTESDPDHVAELFQSATALHVQQPLFSLAIEKLGCAIALSRRLSKTFPTLGLYYTVHQSYDVSVVRSSTPLASSPPSHHPSSQRTPPLPSSDLSPTGRRYLDVAPPRHQIPSPPPFVLP